MGLTSKTALARWNQHVSNAKHKGSGRHHFANAIRAYGKDAFSLSVLEVCDSLESANEAEKRWILEFDSTSPEKGFNAISGGAHTPHPVTNPWDRPGFGDKYRTPEHRAKMVEVNRTNTTKAWASGKFDGLSVKARATRLAQIAAAPVKTHTLCRVHGPVPMTDTRKGQCRTCFDARIKRNKAARKNR